MPKVKLTIDYLRALPAGPCEVWDTKVRGLVLRVRGSGRAYWYVIQGRGEGSKEALGALEHVGLAEARDLALASLGRASKDRALGLDAKQERRRRRVKQQAGTLKEFLTRKYTPWAIEHRKRGAETVTRITKTFRDFLNVPMPEITTFRLEQWRTRRRRAGKADTTINRDLDALRGVLSRALEWDVLTEHPMRQIKRAKVDVLGRIRFLSADEETRLRAALETRDEARRDGRRRFNAWRTERGYQALPDFGAYPDHLTPLVLLALNTGCRRGELLQLDWSDVDLAAKRLTVRGPAAKSGLTRHIPLNVEAVRVLRAWQTCGTADGLVFPGPDGTVMTDIKTAWAKLMTTARIRGFRFHDLRHTFASKLVQAGVDLNTVRELLGHGDIRMTLRYSHLAPEHRAAAVEKLVSA